MFSVMLDVSAAEMVDDVPLKAEDSVDVTTELVVELVDEDLLPDTMIAITATTAAAMMTPIMSRFCMFFFRSSSLSTFGFRRFKICWSLTFASFPSLLPGYLLALTRFVTDASSVWFCSFFAFRL